jgi:N-acyl-D-amino-acid deacylase
MQRRTFLRTSSLGIFAASAFSARATEPGSLEEAFDAEMEAFMTPRGVPGGSLAVAKGGRLLYAKGYGWADRDTKTPVTNESLFRIASLSKPITAVAILQLVEAGKVSLDANPFQLLDFDPAKAKDPRLGRITVRHLLHHTGGWDRDKSFDPMFRPLEIGKELGMPGPAEPFSVIRYMFERPLDFDPGTNYAYSNFGYCMLGRIIEWAMKMPYEKYVQEKVLAPCGIRDMRIGATLREKQAPGEVCYYTTKSQMVKNIFSDKEEMVPQPYGGFHLEAMDSHGAWIASAVDLVRFASALDDPAHSPLLRPTSFETMVEPPAPPVSRKEDGSLKDFFYGCGWDVRPKGDGRANCWHTGSLPGTATLLVRRFDGMNWAVCFNLRSGDSKLPDGAIDAAMHRAAGRVKTWPEGTVL